MAATRSQDADQVRLKLQALQDDFRTLLLGLAGFAEKRSVKMILGVVNADEGANEEDDQRRQKQPLASILRQKVEAIDLPYKIAVVGDFSRGKSTLINALLGKKVLVNDFRPNTAVQTILRYGYPERFKIVFQPELQKPPLVKESADLFSDLGQYISESRVEENDSSHYKELLSDSSNSLANQIERVEVWCQSDFLQIHGIEIIDTPGLGSVFKAHRLVTERVIPSVDAALFAIQIDPGVGQSEIVFIRYIREYASRLIFVMTKADMVPHQELGERIEYARATLQTIVGMNVEYIYPVAAQRVLDGLDGTGTFMDFVNGLKAFLFQSSGAARMIAPVDMAIVQCQQMQAAVQRDKIDLQRTHREREEALLRLTTMWAEIVRKERDLLAQVDSLTEKIIQVLVADINQLPELIQTSVEHELDGLQGEQFDAVEIHILAAMKERITAWLQEKRPRYEVAILDLNRDIQRKVNEILEPIQAPTQIYLEDTIELQFDKLIGVDYLTRLGLNNRLKIGERITSSLASVRASVGLRPELADRFSPIADQSKKILDRSKKITGDVSSRLESNPSISRLGKGLGRWLSNLQSEAAEATSQSREKVGETLRKARDDLFRSQIRQILLKPMADSPTDFYHLFVFGYQSHDGQHVSGFSETIRARVEDRSRHLQADIALFIENSLTSQLEQLQQQVTIKRESQEIINDLLEIYEQQEIELAGLDRGLQNLKGRLATFVHQ